MSEQNEFAEAVRALLAAHYENVTARNAVSDSELGYSEDVWNALGEMNVQGIVFPEEFGGLEASVEDLAAVLAEVGRVLAPEPLLDAVFVPGFLVERLGTDEQKNRILNPLSTGELKLALAHEEYGSRWPGIRVETKATGTTLTGTKFPVAAGPSADLLVVSAKQENGALGIYLVDAKADGVTIAAYPTNDERRGAEITFNGAAAELLGTGADVDEALADMYVYAQILQSAETAGSLREGLKITVEYIKQREQFGKPLSVHQTLQHRASDLHVLNELTSSIVKHGVESLANGEFDKRIASQVKLQLGRAGTQAAEQYVQMHGGIGITFEYPISHYLSRVVATTRTFGATEDHLRVLADTVTVD